MGGSDQWGNIITGTELIRRKMVAKHLHLPVRLLTKSDGGKFGKTKKEIYGLMRKNFALSILPVLAKCSDADAEKWIKIFTFLS